MTIQVQQVPITRIIVKDRFRQDVGELTELIESIKEKGILQPITVDPHMRLIAGERRLLAANEAGLEEIPVIVRESNKLDSLEVELLENICRKNLLWHERAKLEYAIYELKGSQDPLYWSLRKQAKLTGADASSVHRRIRLAEALDTLPDLAELDTEDEAWKALSRLVEDEAVRVQLAARPPEVVEAWKHAGKHYRVGDAFEGLEKTKANTADFVEVDPPYAVELGGHKNTSGTLRSQMSQYEEVKGKDYPHFIKRLAPELHRVLKNDTYMVFWFGFIWHRTIREALEKAGFVVGAVPAIWYKGPIGQSSQPDISLANSYEQFFVCRKGSPKLAIPGRSNVFDYDPVPYKQKIHPTERPVDLMEDILRTFCFPGSTIISPFLGSGSILRACYRTGHTGFGWDLSEEHKQAFLNRLGQDMTGNDEDGEDA